MGWLSFLFSSSSSKSGSKPGSKGKPGGGYGKGSANKNPSKWKPRTPAQVRKSEKTPKTWR